MAPAPAVQVTTLLDELRQTAEPEPADKPVKETVEARVAAPFKVLAPLTVKVPARETESDKARLTEPPKETDPPPDKLVPAERVMEELDKAELGILEKLLDEPDKVLLVRVWVVSVPTRVVVASGRVIVLATVGVQVKVPVGPPDWKVSWFLAADKSKEEKVGELVDDIS